MAAVDSFQFLYREISRTCGSYLDTLALVGALYTASRAVGLLNECCSIVRVHFLPRMLPNKKLTHKYGDWAVICGASEPVAKAYAEQLARHGIHLVFVTHDDASVIDTAAAIAQTYRVETRVITADFSLGQANVLKPVREALRDKDVGFLVNCVDESGTSPQNLVDVTDQILLDQVNKNISSATLMTRTVLPGMLRRSRGAVINISSGASCKPLEGAALLNAFGGYLDSFSRALHFEYSGRGIFIQSLIPLQIASTRHPSSPSSSVVREGWFSPKPDVYARHALSTLGISHRTTGYWPHTLQYELMKFTPEWLWVFGLRVLF